MLKIKIVTMVMGCGYWLQLHVAPQLFDFITPETQLFQTIGNFPGGGGNLVFSNSQIPLKTSQAIETVGRMNVWSGLGGADVELDVFAQKFIEEVRDIQGTVADIGAGFGLVARTALTNGAKRVIAVDVNPMQLKTIWDETPLGLRHNLELYLGAFPDPPVLNPNRWRRHHPRLAVLENPYRNFDLIFHQKDNHLNAIWMGRVAHLLMPHELVRSLIKLYNFAAPGAKFYLTATTPYSKPFTDFRRIFEGRLQRGTKHPGIVLSRKYLGQDKRYGEGFPPMLNLLVPQTLEKLISYTPWTIEEGPSFYREPESRSDNMMQSEEDRGRERVGVVLVKADNSG